MENHKIAYTKKIENLVGKSFFIIPYDDILKFSNYSFNAIDLEPLSDRVLKINKPTIKYLNMEIEECFIARLFVDDVFNTVDILTIKPFNIVSKYNRVRDFEKISEMLLLRNNNIRGVLISCSKLSDNEIAKLKLKYTVLTGDCLGERVLYV